MEGNILVIGSSGQIGSELVMELRKSYGNNKVIASDITNSSYEIMNSGPFVILDVLNKKDLYTIVKNYQVSEIYLLAAILSANAEKNIKYGWELNMNSYFNILELAKERIIKKVFWPSSIAVFGPNSPKKNTGQYAIMNPTTVYGISKLAGENWNEYYYRKFKVDIRSIRYPGLIGWKSKAGGGTTDYAVDIFHQAFTSEKFNCFLSHNTEIPMMYMKDAIRATLELMSANYNDINIRSSYNISGFSFCPNDIYSEIKKYFPKFEICYAPDFRDDIAKTWPDTIDDSEAKLDWKWKTEYGLKETVKEIICNLKPIYKTIDNEK
ncbi:MAG: NAD-dependent epimerase [Flavobacteriales bacterium]|nr:NAD-dependent epimerase [Flavobacteriales bacterium]|tara:strand:- start:1060 stop:2028 length:969 start_codon:yes stop_codon:yes gene_type:complete